MDVVGPRPGPRDRGRLLGAGRVGGGRPIGRPPASWPADPIGRPPDPVPADSAVRSDWPTEADWPANGAAARTRGRAAALAVRSFGRPAI